MTEVITIFKTDYDPQARKNMRSFNGKILHIHLGEQRIWLEEPGEDFYRKYIGGRGVVLYHLLNQMRPGTDALGPENVLVFAPGVLTGTILPGTGRHGVGAKSPLTNALASGEAGGWWGSELKNAGFDAIVLQGKSERPVYLWIHDGVVEIRDAAHLWGKLTGETEDLIREEVGDPKAKVSMIGPAGERLVRYASIINDSNRTAGRSGLGAVMGSKNLKAIAVRGTASPGLADKALMQQVMRWITGSYKDLMGWAVNAGTSGSVQFLHDVGSTPIHNYQDGVFENVGQLDASHFFPILLVGRDTCNHCPVRCKIVVEKTDGEGIQISRKYGGPEYESIGGLGPLCMVSDPVKVAKANELCTANGLDTISTGATIAFTMECVEKGLLTPGVEFPFIPTFGDGDALIESVRCIAARTGIGEWMAEGSTRMAARLGGRAQDYVVATKGQEFAMHDPRFRNATGLGYALSPTGADHMHNMSDLDANNPNSDTCARLNELGAPTPLPMFGLPEEKVRAFSFELAFKHFSDSAVFCQFYPYQYHHMIDALKAAAGWEMTQEEIVAIGNRIATMARLFLVREGFTAEDDRLPVRMSEAHDRGPIAGRVLADDVLRQAVRTHYRLMGWDEQGAPKPETIRQLELEWVS